MTVGSLPNPRVTDDNDGRSLQTRLIYRPHPAISLGASGATGAYLSSTLDSVVPAGTEVESFRQRAAGADLVLSAGRWELRSEVIGTWWSLPAVTDPRLRPTFTALAWWSEGRVRLWPGVDLTVRGERLSFSDVDTVQGPTPWEAGVSRIEAGVAAAVHRRVRAKLAWQYNSRPLGGRVREDHLLVGQLVVWF